MLRQRRENDEIYVRNTTKLYNKIYSPETEQLQPKDENYTATEERTVVSHAVQETSKYINPI